MLGKIEGEAWHAAVHGIAKSRTRLSDWTELDCTELCYRGQGWARNSLGDQRTVEQDRAAAWPGSVSQRAPQSRCSLGRNGCCVVSLCPLFGNTSFLIAGHLRAFKEYGMMPQEGDVLCRPIWPGNAFRPRWSNAPWDTGLGNSGLAERVLH